MENKKSFFLSHASEDKDFVREVYKSLQNKENIDCWFDEAEILPGDILIDKVFVEGFNTSKYVVLFLSKAFINKNWPVAELKTVISKQIRLNVKIIIPFLLDISFEELVAKFPFFEPIACSEAVDLQNVVKLLKSQIKRDNRIINTPKRATSIISPKKETEFSTFLKTPAVQEVSRLADTFFVSYHRAPLDLKIDVLQYDKDFYMGICNYGIWGPDQATPYKSIRPCETIEAAHDLTQARDTSLYCSIKKSLRYRLSESKTFVLIVGKHTNSITKGGCQFCQSYNSWTYSCAKGYSVDYRSYIKYECETAVNDYIYSDLSKIVVLYNSTKVNKNLCPEILKNRGIHIPMKFYSLTDGKNHWNYNQIKEALN